jgi:hypothetical protein
MSTVEIAPTTIPVGSYTVDPAHSSFEFGVRHMMISTVRGRFLDFEATLEGGEQPRIKGSIETAAPSRMTRPATGTSSRPTSSTSSATRRRPSRARWSRPTASGRLTLKGVSRPDAVKVNGPVRIPGGAGGSASSRGRINRQSTASPEYPLPGGGACSTTPSLTASLSFQEA